jgi:hypothetical protein
MLCAMSAQGYCAGLTIRSFDQGAVMRGLASVRYFAAAAAACLVSLLSAAPGWAQDRGTLQRYGTYNPNYPLSFPVTDPYNPTAAYTIAGAPNGFYFNTSSGLGIFNTHVLPLNRADLAFGDLIDQGPVNASSTTYVSGLGGGFNAAPVNLFGTPVVFGGVFEYDIVNPTSTTITGSQTVGLPFAVNTASTTIKDNHFWTAGLSATVPFFPATFQGMSIMGQAGFAEITKTVTFNCNNWCTTALVPSFAESQRINIPGWYAGFQVQQQTAFFGLPVVMYFSYKHIQGTNGQIVSFGTPQTVFASSNITQGINLFQFGTSIPLSTVVTVVSSVIPGNRAQ